MPDGDLTASPIARVWLFETVHDADVGSLRLTRFLRRHSSDHQVFAGRCLEAHLVEGGLLQARGASAAAAATRPGTPPPIR